MWKTTVQKCFLNSPNISYKTVSFTRYSIGIIQRIVIVASLIMPHNKTIPSGKPISDEQACSRRKDKCPLNWKCVERNVIYYLCNIKISEHEEGLTENT